MSVNYQIEPLAVVRPEIEAILPAMWAEMAEGFEEERAEPNWEMYLALERKKAAFLLTAREAGVFVGYLGILVYPNSSLRNELSASSTSYYVVKRRDRGVILRGLIRYAADVCRRAGVRKMTVKTHPWASAEPVLVNLAFREIEKIFMLDLTSVALRETG